MAHNRWLTALAGATLLAAVPVPTQAQDPPFDRVQVQTVVLKPGAFSAWQRHYKLVNEARVKMKDPTPRQVWMAGRGGPARTSYIVTNFAKWGDTDDWMAGTLAKAFGEAEAVRIGDALTAATESSEVTVLNVWKGMNIYKPGTYEYAWVSELHVKPDMQATFQQQVAGRLAVQRKVATHPMTIRYRTGLGHGDTAYMLRFFNKWSEVDTWPNLREVGGAAEMDKLQDALQRSIVSQRNFIIRLNKDLSYTPASATTSQ